MSEQKKSVSENAVLNVISSYIKSVSDASSSSAMRNALKRIPATVVSYNKDSLTAIVTLAGDDSGSTYRYYNKTGGQLGAGDRVWIEYTVNPATGILISKLGAASEEGEATTILPVTGMTINGNGDFTINTNAGTERYIAVFGRPQYD